MKLRKICYGVLFMMLCFITGCAKPTTYTYRTTGKDIVKSLYLEKTEYYPDKIVIYLGGENVDASSFDYSVPFEVKGNKLILKSDSAGAITSFEMNANDMTQTSYRFRYLDTNQYACICTIMDSEGGLHDSGSIDRFYTYEEKAAQKERVEKLKNEQRELFTKYEGTWTSEEGYYLKIYENEDVEDNYCVELYLEDREDIATYVGFYEYSKGDKKGLDIGYIDGPFDACIPLDISEDGNSLIYNGITFTKE